MNYFFLWKMLRGRIVSVPFLFLHVLLFIIIDLSINNIYLLFIIIYLSVKNTYLLNVKVNIFLNMYRKYRDNFFSMEVC
jgi:hypothetical protein